MTEPPTESWLKELEETCDMTTGPSNTLRVFLTAIPKLIAEIRRHHHLLTEVLEAAVSDDDRCSICLQDEHAAGCVIGYIEAEIRRLRDDTQNH